MTPKEAIARARSQLGQKTVYRMGGGKSTPTGQTCHDELRSCDCSSFVCWVLKQRKYQADEFWWLAQLNGGWLNTDGMWVDATGGVTMNIDDALSGPRTTGNFSLIRSPLPGAIAVYPASWVSKKEGPRVGHVGVVTAVRGQSSWDVIHCSKSNWLNGDAIQETGPGVFLGVSSLTFAWCASVSGPVL